MEENIVTLIAEAEGKAVTLKSAAQEDAAKLLSEAEERAAQIAKDSEKTCTDYRAQALRTAEKEAQGEYDRALAASRAKAAAYAEKLLGSAEPYVAEIVGRIVK